MTDTQPLTTDVAADAFETAVKNAFAALSERSADELTREAVKETLDSAMTEQYNRVLDPIRSELDAARERGDEIAVSALEAALDEARDELGGMFAAGYSRLNRALDAVEQGTITYQFSGDGETLTMISHKEDRENSRYVFSEPDESGHRNCECPDKTENDDFPVCKHELSWLLYQATVPFVNADPAVADGVFESGGETDGDGGVTFRFANTRR